MHTTSFGPELTSISFGCQEEVNMNLKNTRAYGSQFSGEKNGLKIRYLAHSCIYLETTNIISMQVCKYANMELCKYTIIQVCK